MGLCFQSSDSIFLWKAHCVIESQSDCKKIRKLGARKVDKRYLALWERWEERLRQGEKDNSHLSDETIHTKKFRKAKSDTINTKKGTMGYAR